VHSTTHTPQAYNVVGGVGGWVSGSPEYWNSYISVNNNQDEAATPDTQYAFASVGEVTCSFIGGGIYYLADTVYIKIVRTTMILKDDLGAGVCLTKPDCEGGVTPLCGNGSVEVFDGAPSLEGWVCYTTAYRSSQSDPFTCNPFAFCRETTELPGPCDQ
jgi:hypothetical protein